MLADVGQISHTWIAYGRVRWSCRNEDIERKDESELRIHEDE